MKYGRWGVQIFLHSHARDILNKSLHIGHLFQSFNLGKLILGNLRLDFQPFGESGYPGNRAKQTELFYSPFSNLPFKSLEKLKTMLMQNFGGIKKECSGKF